MNTIVNNEIEKVKAELRQITKDYRVVSRELKEKLTKLGFEEICLGTGKQSYSSSLQIDVWTLKNTFVEGVYVGVGLSNIQYGKGNRYYAMVKKVI